MVQQRLERDFTTHLKLDPNIWFQRLYHVAGLYTSVPGDFLVLGKGYSKLVECKECRGPRFTFDRLTQRNDLKRFDDFYASFTGLILVCFWKGRVKSSYYFMIPIRDMLEFIKKVDKKSANLDDFLEHLGEFQITLYK